MMVSFTKTSLRNNTQKGEFPISYCPQKEYQVSGLFYPQNTRRNRVKGAKLYGIILGSVSENSYRAPRRELRKSLRYGKDARIIED